MERLLHRLWALCALSLCLLTGCEQSHSLQSSETATAERPLPATTWFPLRLGDQEIQVQLALTDAERQRGLMERESLDSDSGMLFLFERPQRMAFWMENTPLPLSIGYFNPEGVLMEIYTMEPYDRNTTTSRDSHLQSALEMKQGWFRARGVQAGERLDTDQLRTAIQARGFDPASYGL